MNSNIFSASDKRKASYARISDNCQKSANSYKQEGDSLAAAENYIKAAGAEARLANYLHASNLYGQAAQYYVKLEDKDKAAEQNRASCGYASCYHQNLAKDYKQKENYLLAADNYCIAAKKEAEISNFQSAHYLYAKGAQCFEQSANMNESIGYYHIAMVFAKKAKECSAVKQYTNIVINICKNSQQKDKIFLKGDHIAKAIVLLDIPEKAALHYVDSVRKAKDYDEKVICYLMAGNIYNLMPNNQDFANYYFGEARRIANQHLDSEYAGKLLKNFGVTMEENVPLNQKAHNNRKWRQKVNP